MAGALRPTIEVTEVEKQRLCFTLRNADDSLANALRRIMISEVPTLAIELVEFIDNTSVLHDEFIAHRLGLLPIDSSRIKEYKYKEDCSCADRCPNCSVTFQLDVLCRENEGCTVTHLDILGTDPSPNVPMPVPRAEELSAAEGNGIVIARLKKNQRLKCELIATKGIGKLHAKWIPTATAVYQGTECIVVWAKADSISLCALMCTPEKGMSMHCKAFEPLIYSYVEEREPEITFNQRLLETTPPAIQQAIARSCPQNVFSCEGDAFTPAMLAVTNRMACIFCGECEATAKANGYAQLLRVQQRPGVFRFTVEGTGALPPEQIVEMALDILEQRLQVLSEEVCKESMGTQPGRTMDKVQQGDVSFPGQRPYDRGSAGHFNLNLS